MAESVVAAILCLQFSQVAFALSRPSLFFAEDSTLSQAQHIGQPSSDFGALARDKGVDEEPFVAPYDVGFSAFPSIGSLGTRRKLLTQVAPDVPRVDLTQAVSLDTSGYSRAIGPLKRGGTATKPTHRSSLEDLVASPAGTLGDFTDGDAAIEPQASLVGNVDSRISQRLIQQMETRHKKQELRIQHAQQRKSQQQAFKKEVPRKMPQRLTENASADVAALAVSWDDGDGVRGAAMRTPAQLPTEMTEDQYNEALAQIAFNDETLRSAQARTPVTGEQQIAKTADGTIMEGIPIIDSPTQQVGQRDEIGDRSMTRSSLLDLGGETDAPGGHSMAGTYELVNGSETSGQTGKTGEPGESLVIPSGDGASSKPEQDEKSIRSSIILSSRSRIVAQAASILERLKSSKIQLPKSRGIQSAIASADTAAKQSSLAAGGMAVPSSVRVAVQYTQV